MQIAQSNQDQAKNLNEFSEYVESAMKVIDRYEQSKPGSMAFVKLEEAMLWIQVLIMNGKLKQENDLAA